SDRRLVGIITGLSTQPVATGTGPSGAPMPNKDGLHIAFESRSDLLGDGHDTGIWQIYLYDRTVGQLFQMTSGDGDSHNPYIEEKTPGSIFFDSTATNLLGLTATSTGRQIFRVLLKDQPTNDPAVEQWTFGPGNSWMPAVEPNGLKVVF